MDAEGKLSPHHSTKPLSSTKTRKYQFAYGVPIARISIVAGIGNKGIQWHSS